PGRVTLYRVGTIKRVTLPKDTKDDAGRPISERTYVSVDGGMSDNIRPTLYGADYTALLASRDCGGERSENGGLKDAMLARVVGMHCESGDIIVRECSLPRDLKRGDIIAVPVTGAYGRTMASNYNQALIPAVVAVSDVDAHIMLRRQTLDDLLSYDAG
ncbi:diaminopimelate decarboxylase, partial [Bifidobacterium commune]|uniref:diaminopimelate decarboxylase family protein n=1 Tax=Bifidobacterium commune TaxID=1505727 RepID=UPI0017EF20CD|nr:diaminopimelate decarboxylase [Bifidobacterium commune]